MIKLKVVAVGIVKLVLACLCLSNPNLPQHPPPSQSPSRMPAPQIHTCKYASVFVRLKFYRAELIPCTLLLLRSGCTENCLKARTGRWIPQILSAGFSLSFSLPPLSELHKIAPLCKSNRYAVPALCIIRLPAHAARLGCITSRFKAKRGVWKVEWKGVNWTNVGLSHFDHTEALAQNSLNPLFTSEKRVHGGAWYGEQSELFQL